VCCTVCCTVCCSVLQCDPPLTQLSAKVFLLLMHHTLKHTLQHTLQVTAQHTKLWLIFFSFLGHMWEINQWYLQEHLLAVPLSLSLSLSLSRSLSLARTCLLLCTVPRFDLVCTSQCLPMPAIPCLRCGQRQTQSVAVRVAECVAACVAVYRP